jgi:sigma-54-specific transcriptional regulator
MPSSAYSTTIIRAESAPASELVAIAGRQTNPRIIAASAIVFEDPKSKEVARQIDCLAPSDANILLVGETGTGKEVAARRLHELSRRKDQPFVAVNCASLCESLAESELFGHERGAFTGAHATTAGWFEIAKNGTLFLDEIGELSLNLQSKLLRVLQQREVVRVGARRAIPIDVRLITATNVNLEKAMAAGKFREDLFYRIKVASISLPPLRERALDIEPLAQHFLKLYEDRLGLKGVEFAAETIRKLTSYPWPGNIRELENVIHYALLVSRDRVIAPGDLHLPEFTSDSAATGEAQPYSIQNAITAAIDDEQPNLFEIVTRALIGIAFEKSGENQVKAAAMLGISRNTLRSHLAKIGVVKRRSARRPLLDEMGEQRRHPERLLR